MIDPLSKLGSALASKLFDEEKMRGDKLLKLKTREAELSEKVLASSKVASFIKD